MSIETIKKLKIIRELKKHDDYYKKFENIVDFYSQILDNGAVQRDVGFTPHDFTHHCKNIYEILGNILPKAFYSKYSNGSNLFLLLTAVLLHDISMALDGSMEARRAHSKSGKDYVIKQIIEEEGSCLNINCRKSFVDALGDIIYAHSDIKDDNDNIIVHTFVEIVNKYNERNDMKTVGDEELNVPFLAALLRLADELDISYKRVEGTGYKSKKIEESSMKHYLVCEYFEQIQLHKNNPYVLSIEVIESVFMNVPEADKTAVSGQIIGKYVKIKKEFELLYNTVLSNNKYVPKELWGIERVQLRNEEIYKDYIKKKDE